MKNKKILIAIVILFVMILITTFVIIFISKLNEDKKNTEENITVINNSYDNFKNEITNYNNIRNDITDFINNFYYETIEEKYQSNLDLLNNYDEIINKITTEVKVLDDKCKVTYVESGINNICESYKLSYETIVNVFMNDLNNYNNKLDSYNKNESKNLELFKSKYINDYIDYNNDNNYAEKVEVNG